MNAACQETKDDENKPSAHLRSLPRQETGLFGFAYHFEGRPPHFAINTCRALQDVLVLDHCDAHREHVWEEASDAARPPGSFLPCFVGLFGYNLAADMARVSDVTDRSHHTVLGPVLCVRGTHDLATRFYATHARRPLVCVLTATETGAPLA
jgi:hypothetical protein